MTPPIEAPIKIDHLDHLVLTVQSIETSCRFYTEILGMKLITFADDRKALAFGNQKINLHRKGHEHEPNAKYATPGSADLCFITETPLDVVMKQLQHYECSVELGPVARTGANGPIRSIYVRDPDQNLIELSNLISINA